MKNFARFHLSTRSDECFPFAMRVVERLEQQHFGSSTARARQVQPRGHDLRIVHHQHVAVPKELWQVSNDCIAWRRRTLIDE